MRIDQILLDQVKKKDRSALETLYERYHKLLISIISVSNQDPILTEKILTELFKELWETPNNFNGRHLSLSIVNKCKIIVKKYQPIPHMS